MDILDAFYGRVANVPECPSDSGVTDCGSPSGLLQKLKDQCDGQGSCTVKADPEELGDECPGVEKYLTIDFRCN
ncbi:unnamed protein product [Vitrella brassicaformis CCMP3155]|uniref:SUEL-type lectin domain-containing protein n=1 Tax=Vitrella brassicaformis (strain CCMP3155) TaxID=1169540 RepID=A0A0G4GMQ9_VITBC|nr:unnamed protein product [Vitrella brassicaformis CCMP3155]|eukprot:CEM31479.1 unnamed protein product [Vitrella brassicaformis CCMP3155]